MTLKAENVRIAVVDDDPALLDTFSYLMKRAHYHADFFSEPTKALDKISQHPRHYQLLVVDINMPGVDGVEFSRRARAIAPDLPIIFITGGTSSEKRAEAMALGGKVTFLEKPFPLEQVLQKSIEQFLQKS
jgi:CheY-like chemotaxis protein